MQIIPQNMRSIPHVTPACPFFVMIYQKVNDRGGCPGSGGNAAEPVRTETDQFYRKDCMMKIEKKENGNEITLMLAGRLDTTTAPQLETEINACLEGAGKLILDFQELEYLSSAGLRVLLSAHKAFMKRGSGELLICHVNETINEVFEVTGFLDILNIE